MENLKVIAHVVEGIGKKSGKPYKAVEIFITEKVKKLIFLTEAEWELLRLIQSK